MAEIDAALTTYLLAYPGLSALIGSSVYPDCALQGTAQPYVIYQFISDVKEHFYTVQDTLEHPNIQFTVYAASRSSARAIGNQIKAALCDYAGTLSGVVVQNIQLINELPYTDHNSDGTVKAHTVDLEFLINYIRSD